MSDIDEKLGKILDGFDHPKDDDKYWLARSVTVQDIKQAFTEAGYIKPSNGAVHDVQFAPEMTGYEWYHRFERELTAIRLRQSLLVRDDYVQAAKKASGVTNE